MTKKGDELVPAKCGKMKKASGLKNHERLCSECLRLSGITEPTPLEKYNAGQQEQRDLELQSEVREAQAELDDTTVTARDSSIASGEDNPAGTLLASSESPASSPEDALVDKTLAKVLPAIQANQKETMDYLKGLSIPNAQQVQEMVKTEVKNVITAIMTEKEGTPVSNSNGGNQQGSGGLSDLILLAREFMHKPVQNTNPFEAMKPFFEFMNNQWMTLNTAQKSGVDLATSVIQSAVRGGADADKAAAAFANNFHPNATPKAP